LFPYTGDQFITVSIAISTIKNLIMRQISVALSSNTQATIA